MLEKNINQAFHQVNWPITNALAFTTTRKKPVQQQENIVINSFNVEACFDGFNLAFHVEDNASNVKNNREILSTQLPKSTQVQWLEQIHAADVVEVINVQNTPYIADAAYTNKPGVALAIMTADCLPLLIATSNGKEIAAIHGGWRPLAKNIIANTLLKFEDDIENIHVWLGPCIGSTVFEVGNDVFDIFIEQNLMFKSAFKLVKEGKYLADLTLIAKLQLQQLGVKHIYQQNDCTYLLPQQYYSFRRDGKTGRMASIICRLP